jgi:hypothetical protein
LQHAAVRFSNLSAQDQTDTAAAVLARAPAQVALAL